jgi:group I intron endonuclease
MIGIYKLHTPSNKIYIGQSWDILKRWSAHKSGVGVLKYKLYCSLENYKWEEVQKSVEIELAENTSQGVMDWWEQFFVEYYKDQGFEMLNIREPGSRGKNSESTNKKLSEIGKSRALRGALNPYFGKKHSAETKKKMRGSYKLSGDLHPRKRSISQFDLSGKLIKVWTTIAAASNNFEVTHSAIISACKKKSDVCAGYYWRYTNELDNDTIEIEDKKYNCRPVLQLDTDGNIVNEWKSVQEAGRRTTASATKISCVCRGVRKSTGGFIWKYKEIENG